MNRLLIVVPILALGLWGRSCSGPRLIATLYAQSVPSVKHATWTPNAASENVADYQVFVDGVATTAPLTGCTATLCTAPITLAAWGQHTVYVVARNLDMSGANTVGTLQAGPPSVTVTLALNRTPSVVTGTKVGN